jgi:hypothetical protein
MISMHVLDAIALVVAGVSIGGVGIISLGIKRDDRRGRFPADTDDPITRAARRATGLGTRGPDRARGARLPQRQPAGLTDGPERSTEADHRPLACLEPPWMNAIRCPASKGGTSDNSPEPGANLLQGPFRYTANTIAVDNLLEIWLG